MNSTTKKMEKEHFNYLWLPKTNSAQAVMKELGDNLKPSEWEDLGVGKVKLMENFIYICLKQWPRPRNNMLR